MQLNYLIVSSKICLKFENIYYNKLKIGHDLSFNAVIQTRSKSQIKPWRREWRWR